MQKSSYTREKCYLIEGRGEDLKVTEIPLSDANQDQSKGGIPIETMVVVEEYVCSSMDMGDCLVRALCNQ